MLPSHLIDSTKKKDERLSHTRLGQPPPAPMPSLCVTGALSQMGRCEAGAGVSLSYCIFRPRQIHDTRRPPLVVLHGGPSIPSNYLLPIVNGVIDRTVIFYDQYGCGKSSRPSRTKEKEFSIDLMVKHLDLLISKQWGLEKYHLLGHSFGGILGYEYLASISKEDRTACQSLILASTPTSAQLIQDESKRMYRTVNNLGEDHDEQLDDPEMRQLYGERFRQTHECRLPQPPLAFLDAMAQAGPTPWRGINAISGYQAQHSLSGIPTLTLRGEYDFCTEKCISSWKELLSNPSPISKVLSNCSHYGMLEDEQQFGKAITEFLVSIDTAK